MAAEISSQFIDLVQDALLKSFWRKPALQTFLRRHKISDNFLATLDASETKRIFLNRLFPKLEASEKGRETIRKMADFLVEQVAFPDLKGWEDADIKIEDAKAAVGSLKQFIEIQKRKEEVAVAKENIKHSNQKRTKEAIAKQETLETLAERLRVLSKNIGEQEAGYEFQKWFYDLVGIFELEHRRPYNTDGRQIDGSVTHEGTTYLVELKFTKEQSAATDIDSLLSKVNSKADNTMGIMVSMSGYSGVAITEASRNKSPLILMDYSHVYLILSGTWQLPELIGRLRRHVSQTGEAFLAASEFAT